MQVRESYAWQGRDGHGKTVRVLIVIISNISRVVHLALEQKWSASWQHEVLKSSYSHIMRPRICSWWTTLTT